MTRVQDVVTGTGFGGPTSGRRVDNPPVPPTGPAANHRNLSFDRAASTGRSAQVPGTDLRVRRVSTETNAPPTTTKFQLIPRRATTGAFRSVWRTPPWQDAHPGSLSNTMPRSRSLEMERNHL